MGTLFTSKPDKQVSILLDGLKSSGKSTILNWIIHGKFIEPAPTSSFNLETIVVGKNKTKVSIWEPAPTNEVFKGELKESLSAIIYVIDSTKKEQFRQCKSDISQLLENEFTKNVVFLVYANKQDLENSVDVKKIKLLFSELFMSRRHRRESYEYDEYGQENRKSDDRFMIQSCSAKTGEGVKEGFEWLIKKV